MKKTILKAFLLAAVFAVLIVSCASYAESKPGVNDKVKEGDFYTFYFRYYVYWRVNGKAPVTYVRRAPARGGGGATTGSNDPFIKQLIEGLKEMAQQRKQEKQQKQPPSYGGFPGELMYLERPRGVPEHNPNEQDIDMAIAAYEEALRINPSGTYGGVKGYVKVLLENARKYKQQWLAVEKPNLDQRLAAERAKQAEQQRLAQERANRSVTQDMFEVEQLANNTIKIKKYTGDVENVVIPSTLYNLPVTVIGEGAFARSGIKSVVIPDTVTSIGNAFENCVLLTSVTIGNGVKSIGDSAFRDCTSLTNVTIGSKVTHIGDSAFRECKALTSITIPDSVVEIGKAAFYSCGLTSVTLGKGLKTIKGYEGHDYYKREDSIGAFERNNLISITFPTGLTEIGQRAFEYNKLTSVVLPAGLKTIGANAFGGNPIQSVTIPAGVSIVFAMTTRDYIFQDHSSRTLNPITRITLPANIELAHYGFEDTFVSFYKNQNRAAGTYEKNGPIWARSRAGGVD